jgi:hypothetical protein
MDVNKFRNHKLLIIVGVLFIITFSIIVVALSAHKNSTPKATIGSCLQRSDYKNLTGKTPTNLDLEEGFYSYTVEFSGATVSYLTDIAPSPQDTIKNIGRFYQSSKGKSVEVSLTSINATTTIKALALQRLQKIKADLVTAGVSEQAIASQEPILSNTEPNTNDIVTIAVTSTEGCQE